MEASMPLYRRCPPPMPLPPAYHASSAKEADAHPSWGRGKNDPDVAASREMERPGFATPNPPTGIGKLITDAAQGALGRLDPRGWTERSLLTGGAAAATAIDLPLTHWLRSSAGRGADEFSKANPNLRWDVVPGGTPSPGFQDLVSRMEGKARSLGDTLHPDAIQWQGRPAEEPVARWQKTRLNRNIALEGRTLADISAVETDGYVPALAHEMGHAGGSQRLRTGALGKLERMAGSAKYRAGRALATIGGGQLARRTLDRDDLSSEEKGKRLALLAAGQAGMNIPGAVQLAEETRATLRGAKLVAGTEAATAYSKLMAKGLGSYAATHAPSMAVAAVTGGFAANELYKGWKEKQRPVTWP